MWVSAGVPSASRAGPAAAVRRERMCTCAADKPTGTDDSPAGADSTADTGTGHRTRHRGQNRTGHTGDGAVDSTLEPFVK